MDELKGFVYLPKIARKLGCTNNCLRERIRSGKLKAKKVKGFWVISEKDCEKLLSEFDSVGYIHIGKIKKATGRSHKNIMDSIKNKKSGKTFKVIESKTYLRKDIADRYIEKCRFLDSTMSIKDISDISNTGEHTVLLYMKKIGLKPEKKYSRGFRFFEKEADQLIDFINENLIRRDYGIQKTSRRVECKRYDECLLAAAIENSILSCDGCDKFEYLNHWVFGHKNNFMQIENRV